MTPPRLWAAALVITATSGCSGRCPSGPAKPDPDPTAASGPAASMTTKAAESYPVTLRFDGGYVFIRSKEDKSLTVAALQVPHDPRKPDSFFAAHQMHMSLGEGNIVSAPPPDVAPRIWSLDQRSHDITVAGYEDNPPGVTFPPEKGIPADPCGPVPEYSAEANNLSLMPTMNQLAARAGFDGALDTTRAKYHNRVTVTSGTMRIVRTTSCFEFMKGAESFGKHRIPSGLSGSTVTFPLRGNLTLNVVDDQGTTTPYVFSPRVDGATGDRILEVYFGRFPPVCRIDEPGCVVLKDQKLEDFNHFYMALKTPPRAEDRVVLINRSETGDVSPRSQCGGIWFDVP